MDLQSDDVKALIHNMLAGIDQMKGHIPIKIHNRRRPVAMYLRSLKDIQNPELLHKSLIRKPKGKPSGGRKSSNNNDEFQEFNLVEKRVTKRKARRQQLRHRQE